MHPLVPIEFYPFDKLEVIELESLLLLHYRLYVAGLLPTDSSSFYIQHRKRSAKQEVILYIPMIIHQKILFLIRSILQDNVWIKRESN